VQFVNLTDDELWHTIAANTDALSELLDQRFELDAEINGVTDLARRSKLMSAYMGAVNQFEAEYRAYTAELRRRHAA
jgi:hypothetical protein